MGRLLLLVFYSLLEWGILLDGLLGEDDAFEEGFEGIVIFLPL